MRHAFFDKDEDGDPISPEYREDVYRNRDTAEWTSTFLEDGKKVIERPEIVIHNEKYGWVTEGGNIAYVDLPDSGFVLEYDKPTGFPSRTSPKKEHAERVFGEDASYFSANRDGLRVIRREELAGPFSIDGSFEPYNYNPHTGGRSTNRSSQDWFFPSTLTQSVILSQKDYDEIMAKYRELGELLSQIQT